MDIDKLEKIAQRLRYACFISSCITAYMWLRFSFPLCVIGVPFLLLAANMVYEIIKHRKYQQDYTIRIGRFEMTWMPGSWYRLDEWLFERVPCDVGCIIFYIGFVVISWVSKEHMNESFSSSIGTDL